MGQPRVVLASLVCVILLAGLQATPPPRGLIATTPEPVECQDDEFYCYNNNKCIPASRVCDGAKDCYYGEDEDSCGCSLPFEEVSSGSGNTGWCVMLDIYEHSWQEARDRCLSLDADLAVLNDWDFYEDLIDYIHKQELDFHDYWVGASDEVEEGVWTWVDGTPVRMGTPLWGLYSNYPYDKYYQEPYAASANGQDCGYLYEDQYYYMVDGDCTNHKTSVCQKRKSLNHGTTILTKDGSINATTITPTKAVPSTKTCTAPFEVLGRRCVWLAMEKVVWLDALYLCRMLGADLAPITDIGLHADLVDYFEYKGVTGSSFWVGANDTTQEGHWGWQDGRTVRMGSPLWRTVYERTYGVWHQEPDTRSGADREDCGILDHEAFHYMADGDCTSKLPAICLMP